MFINQDKTKHLYKLNFKKMKKLLLLLILAQTALFGQQKVVLNDNLKSDYADYFRNAYLQ